MSRLPSSRVLPVLTLVFLFFGLFCPSSYGGSNGLTIATFNIRNFPGNEKRLEQTDLDRLTRLLRSTKADVIGVQEIIDAQELEVLVESALPGHKVALGVCGGKLKQRLGFIYDDRKLELVSLEEDLRLTKSTNNTRPSCHGASRPLVKANFARRDGQGSFLALTVHLKAGSGKKDQEKRNFQLKTLSNILGQLKKTEQNLILLGDFNTTEFLKGGQQGSPERKKFLALSQKHDLTLSTQEAKCSVYWDGNRDNGLEYPSLLDHILVSNSLISGHTKFSLSIGSHCRKAQCQVAPTEDLGETYQAVSDHCPVVFKMES